MPDNFENLQTGLTSPAFSAFTIGTAAYGSALAQTTRGLYVGTGGTVVATMADGAVVTFANVPDGAILPFRVRTIGTATNAAGIVGLV